MKQGLEHWYIYFFKKLTHIHSHIFIFFLHIEGYSANILKTQPVAYIQVIIGKKNCQVYR
jgi:hypothetical protein